MTRLTRLALVPAAALAASFAAAGMPEEARSAGSAAEAGTALCLGRGAPWQRGSTRGTRYVVSSTGVTCAFVRPWVARLSAKPVTRSGQRLSGGPAGYVCAATVPLSGKAAVGACGRTGGKGFAWAPKLG
jgi:hypothetical protein